jgi:hypothetical protein
MSVLDDRERDAAHGEVHPVGVAQGVGHRTVGWSDAGRRSQASQRAVEDLLRERIAVVPDEQS